MKARIQGSTVSTPMDFDDAFRARLRDLLVWRRDVRRFRRDPLPRGTLERLIQLACLAPSVGLSQPWRFVIVDDPARRAACALRMLRFAARLCAFVAIVNLRRWSRRLPTTRRRRKFWLISPFH